MGSVHQRTVHYYGSCCDRTVNRTPFVDAPPAGAHEHCCEECGLNFGTKKAMLTHMRRKHGVRCEQRFYIDADGKCQVCGTVFHSRLRCLAHLCDSRRTRCWDAISSQPSSYRRLPVSTVAALDVQDRELKRLAWRSGHTHVIASKSAVTAAGRRIGHVSV